MSDLEGGSVLEDNAAASGETAGHAARRRKSPRAYLELARVYLVPTALADSFAGFALAAALASETPAPARMLLVAAISALVYAAGMVTNDLFDLSKDRESSPEKPLPAGRVSTFGAAVFAVSLVTGSLVLAGLCGGTLATLLILVLVLAYNGGGKSIPLVGNLLMGGCRAGNWILGAVVAADAGGARGWAILRELPISLGAFLLGAYITVVTAVSLLEEGSDGDRSRKVLALGASTLALPLFLIARAPFAQQSWTAAWIGSVVLATLLLRTLARAAAPPPRIPGAAVFVRGALGCIPALDAALVLGLAPRSSYTMILPALALYALGIFAWWCKRRWLQSGGPET